MTLHTHNIAHDSHTHKHILKASCLGNPFLIQDPGFQNLSLKFQYPEECSHVIVQGVQRTLFIESYRSKFHMLVHLEELECSRKIIKE